MGSVAAVRSRETAAKNRYDNARRCNRPNLRLQAGIFYFLLPVTPSSRWKKPLDTPSRRVIVPHPFHD